MQVVFDRPRALTEMRYSYCPGCHHGIVHRLVAEAIDELELAEKQLL
jgi:2-oxoglutarate ferredoxin oxidoreductase subunit beta